MAEFIWQNLPESVLGLMKDCGVDEKFASFLFAALRKFRDEILPDEEED